MGGKAERRDQLGQIGGGLVNRQSKADVLLDGAPGQQPRLLKDHAEAPGAGGPEFPAEIPVEAGRDPQDRGLAAARRPDQRAEGSRLEPKFQAMNDFDRRAVGRQKGLRIDAKFKRGGVAS